MSTARELKVAIECRAAGLMDPMTALVVEHCAARPSDAARAFAMAEAVAAVGGSTALLQHLLDRDVSVDAFITQAARSVNYAWRLTPTADRALRAVL